MHSVVYLIPIPPGKTEHFRHMSKEALVTRREEHNKSRHRHGFTKEIAWVHSTPQGDMITVYLEAADVHKALQSLVASQDPHDVWFKQEFLALLGIDLSTGLLPDPELVFDWRAG